MARVSVTITTSDTINTGAWTSIATIFGEFAWRVELDHTATAVDVFEVWTTNDHTGSPSYTGSAPNLVPPKGQKLGQLKGANAFVTVQPTEAAAQALYVNVVRVAGSTSGVTAIVSGTGTPPPT